MRRLAAECTIAQPAMVPVTPAPGNCYNRLGNSIPVSPKPADVAPVDRGPDLAQGWVCPVTGDPSVPSDPGR